MKFSLDSGQPFFPLLCSGHFLKVENSSTSWNSNELVNVSFLSPNNQRNGQDQLVVLSQVHCCMISHLMHPDCSF